MNSGNKWRSADTVNNSVLLISDSVTLPRNFTTRISDTISRLNQEYPNWGMAAGNGVLPFGVGPAAEHNVRYSAQKNPPSYLGPNLTGATLPAQFLYGGVLLLNGAALPTVNLPALELLEPELLETFLSLEFLAQGYALIVTPQLSALFDGGPESGGIPEKLLELFLQRTSAQFLETPWGEVAIPGAIAKRFESAATGASDPQDLALRNAAVGRPIRKVAIVTRTIFHRPSLLIRCLETVNAFILRAGPETIFEHHVITSNPDYQEFPLPEHLPAKVTFVDCGDAPDTRYLLVAAAAERIAADYYWFIDDDDWLFPQHSEHLGLAIKASSAKAPVLVRTMLAETASSETRESDYPRFAVFHEYPASNYYRTLTFDSQTPFCGMVFPRAALTQISDYMFGSLTLFEDLYTILHTLLKQDNLPVIVDKLMVGITATSPGNTISRADRAPWDQAMSDVVAELVQDPEGALQLAGVQQMIARQALLEQQNTALEAEVRELLISVDNARHQRELLEHQIAVIKNSTTWKVGSKAAQMSLIRTKSKALSLCREK